MRRPLEAPGIAVDAAAGAGRRDRAADDFIGAGAVGQVAVARAAPQGLRPHAVELPLAITLPQAFGVKIEIAVAVLERAIHRRTPAVALVVVDLRIVWRTATREISDPKTIAADRILVVQARVGEVDQRTEFAVARAPAVTQQQITVDAVVARLIRMDSPDRSGDFGSFKVE